MAVDAIGLLGLFSITIVIGYIGAFIFRRTGISDTIWLLLLGLLLGPGLGWIDRAVFIAVLPLLSALALILILFDAGLNMDFYQMIRGFSRSMLLTIVGVVLSMISVALTSMYLLNFSLLEGLLLGAIVSGTSSAIIVALVSKMKIRDNIKTILTLESIFTDPFTIVIPIALISFLAAPLSAPQTDVALGPATTILSAFSIGAVIGLLGGIIWQAIMDRLKEKHLEYMLTLAAMFLIYIFVETFKGSGALAALMFGLVIGNKRTFYNILKIRKRSLGDHESLKTMQNEVSFFIRSFFFVYLGLIATINMHFLLYGLAIVGTLILARLIAVQISTIKMETRGQEKNIMRTMMGRGLACAVTSQLPLAAGLPNGTVFSNIAFVIILGTTIYTTIMAFVFRPKKRKLNIKSGKRKPKKK